MQLWKRAYLYVQRKKGKTLLLVVTIFFLTSFGVIGLLLRFVTNLAIAQTRQSLDGAFRIAPDMKNSENVIMSVVDGQTIVNYIGEPLDNKIVEAVQDGQNIEVYNAVIRENVLIKGDLSLVDFNGKYRDDPVAMHLISMEAGTCSLYCTDFWTGRLRLIAGDPIEINDKYAAVISSELASKNHLEIGDKIQLSPREGYAGGEIHVTIKGLFNVEAKQQNLDVAAPVHLLENRIFIDITSARLLTGAEGADYINFYVDDPEEVITIIEDIKKIKNINWKNYTISVDIEEYERISNPLADMGVLSETLIMVVGILSVAVLSLIQVFFHKARVREVGIMLSIGVSKAEILLQHFVEMIITALPAFVLSFVLCFSTRSFASGIIYRMAAYGMDLKFDTTLVIQTVITIFGCGILVLFLSVLLSNLWLMRLSPKKILSKLS